MPLRDGRMDDALSAVLPYFCAPGGLLMVLSAYFDESEQHTGTEPLSVGGYLFKPQPYTNFVRKWGRLLESGPTKTAYFHMTDLYAGRRQYRSWSLEDRVAHLALATQAVRKHAYIGACVVFSQTEFERLAPDGWADRYGGIYTSACQLAMSAAVGCLNDRSFGGRVAYVFERGHPYWLQVDALLHGMAGRPDTVEAYKYHSHTDLPKREAFGLQAADMLAWLETRNAVGPPGTKTGRAFAPIVDGLAKGWGDRYRLWRLGPDELRAFFELHTNRPDPPLIVDLGGPKKKRLR